MIIRIKRHFLSIAIVSIIGFMIGSWAISEYRASEASKLMYDIQQSKDGMNQIANGLALMQVTLRDYSALTYITMMIFAGIANGYYLVMAFNRQHGNSPFMLFLYILLFPVVGFIGTAVLVPLILYEGYVWLIKKQAICFFFINAEEKAKSFQECYPQYADDLQKRLIEEYMHTHTKATIVGLTFIIPIIMIGTLIYLNMKSSILSILLLIIFIIIGFVGGILLMIRRQNTNLHLQKAYLKTCDSQRYVDSMAIIVSRCTWDFSNQNVKAEHVNAMLINGDYEALENTIKKYRVPFNSPTRWMVERKLAELKHDDEAVKKYGDRIHRYYLSILKRKPRLKPIIDMSLLNMEIRDDMYNERYEDALEKIHTKPEMENLYDQVCKHYQLGKCYGQLGKRAEAIPHLEFVEEFGNTTAFRKDIQPYLKTLM